MRELTFTKFSPTGNVTVLVETSVPRAEQAGIARELLAADSVGGEQVGFLESPSSPECAIRLQMMGGEFCGNASMSVGCLLAMRDELPDGSSAEYTLEVSGADKPVKCLIQRQRDVYLGTVDMPLPERFDTVTLPTDAEDTAFPAVTLPGITHIIVQSPAALTQEEIFRRIRMWNEIVKVDALGVLRYDADTQSMLPTVYVPASDSAVAESCCGSGSAALGAYLSLREKHDEYVFSQPGGLLRVHVKTSENRIEYLRITGRVRMTARGTAYLPG